MRDAGLHPAEKEGGGQGLGPQPALSALAFREVEGAVQPSKRARQKKGQGSFRFPRLWKHSAWTPADEAAAHGCARIRGEGSRQGTR